ncbi:hypothetical protein JOE33_002657 [Pseudomonas sp. PvP027]|nr:hypothetical protein [Pseudomonas sp. PvP027]
MPCVTLRVTDPRNATQSGEDAERPERHAHAEHGHDSDLPDDYRSSRSSVGMPLRDAPRHRSAQRHTNQERTQSVQNGMPTLEHGHDSDLTDDYRSSRSSVGMPCVTLRVTDPRNATQSGEDAERPERHAHAEHGHDSDLPDDYRSSRSCVGMPCVTLRVTDPRNATQSGEDAERPERHAHAEHGHDSVRPDTAHFTRSAISRTPIVPHAPAWECRA